MKKLRFVEDPRPGPSCGAELGVVPFIQNFSINIDYVTQVFVFVFSPISIYEPLKWPLLVLHILGTYPEY